MNKHGGRVALIGAGPGDPGLLTLRAAHALRSADVLLYDALASSAVLAMASSRCEAIFVGKRGGNHAMSQEDLEALMIRKARAGHRVVRLKGGDPMVFGRGGEEAQALHAAGVPFEIVPGISSAIAAPAYAGIPVTHRDHNAAFTVATGHEDPGKPGSTLDWAKLADPNRTLILLMAMGNLAEIAQKLALHGLDALTPVAVIQDGTRPTQRTVVGTLASIAGDVARAGLEAPAIVVVGNVVTSRTQLAWFDNTPLFGKRVLVVRPAKQAETFAQALYARGAEPIVAPTIAIGPPDDPGPAHRAVDDIASYAWVAFTSQHGVDAFFDRLYATGRDARWIGRVKVAAVGRKTGERLRLHGVHADLVPSVFSGEEVGRVLADAGAPGDRILIFRAQEAPGTFPEILERAHRIPIIVAAYKTSPVRDDEFASKVARADVLTFTSASSIEGFITLLGGPGAAVAASREKTIACIGPITAGTAREFGLHPDIVAETFTADALVDALETHFMQTP